MLTNIIELLQQQVTPIVLQSEIEHLLEKKHALDNFYPILLSLLKQKPDYITELQNHLNPRLSDIFTTHQSLKEKFIEAIGSTAPPSEIEETLNNAIAPTLGVLETQAGSNNQQAIEHFLLNHSTDIAVALPLWAKPLLAALGVNTLVGETLHQSPSNASYIGSKKQNRWWVPVLFIIVLGVICALLFKMCSRDEQPNSVVENTNIASKPAKFQLTTGQDGMLVTCQIFTSNKSYIDILQTEVKQIFTHPVGCGADDNSQFHQTLIDQEAIPSVLKMIKGTPNVSMTWMGDQLSIQAKSNAVATELAQKIQPLVKNMQIVKQQPLDVNQAVGSSVSSAEKALASLNPEHVRALDVATALNLQIINFEPYSSEIPEINQSILDQAAALIRRAPQVNLVIEGHTDNVGTAQDNKELSVKRAQAVMDYLIKKGVDPAKLQAVGMGAEKPIADNNTPEGQFKNRRIEFTVLNTETGKARQVNEQGVSTGSY
ncbi:OmpA family protein [Acinetobacter tibetensis]|uniref:OmpA family protein n=1 Tax=Acinetobacter tibetensis TaxID=2943497 RepID=A0AAE9LTV6_9GAMM|nr:OmpA family protein [Acinetobacter tibetensis]USE84400.1 OmpA family protein [Acinetobacter tibetensis]